MSNEQKRENVASKDPKTNQNVQSWGQLSLTEHLPKLSAILSLIKNRRWWAFTMAKQKTDEYPRPRRKKRSIQILY